MGSWHNTTHVRVVKAGRHVSELLISRDGHWFSLTYDEHDIKANRVDRMEEGIGTFTDEEGCSFLDLPRNVATGILSRLGDTPQDIVSFGRSCRAAHGLACEPALWQQLCCTLSKAFHAPQAWHARSFRHLYLALVYPYRDLLLCKLWHSNLWPCGAYSGVTWKHFNGCACCMQVGHQLHVCRT